MDRNIQETKHRTNSIRSPSNHSPLPTSTLRKPQHTRVLLAGPGRRGQLFRQSITATSLPDGPTVVPRYVLRSPSITRLFLWPDDVQLPLPIHTLASTQQSRQFHQARHRRIPHRLTTSRRMVPAVEKRSNRLSLDRCFDASTSTRRLDTPSWTTRRSLFPYPRRLLYFLGARGRGV